VVADVFADHLRARATVTPGGVAVIDELGAVSNGELDSLTDAVAAEVMESGATRVAIIASNSTRFLAHAFGIWRAGATLVTVYPSSPTSEMGYALAHSDVTLVFADDECAPRVPDGYDVRRIDRALMPDRAAESLDVDRNAVALICYTSGSTQHPKAVMHSHASLLGGALAYAQVWHLGPADTTLVVLPMAWAFGLVTTSMAALISGGQVRSIRRANPELLLKAVVESRVTFIAGVTTIYAKMVEALQGGASIEDHAVRLCISGGEPRNELVFDAWRGLTGVPVHDVYAASECFPVVTYDPFEDPEPTPGFAGRVAPGSALRLWDDASSSWVDGAGVGEAFVQGAAFFSGYEHDPDNTAKALEHIGWYRTGDLVELRDDGLVRVLGRLSGMIIRGGANVAPSEIERVVREDHAVDDAVALGLPDPSYGQRIVVVVTPVPGRHPDPSVIIERCRRELAGYKVPQAVLVVDSLPLNTRTGKIDRRAVEAAVARSASA
jgi:long-chain acyl-CoA synthetase